ncbi:ABC transporter permease subunit [Martelella alba]|uniref:ABC transporter permease subunit n=1 Tax=Martelella alba TaxID=2590451 RepID=A0A506UAS7_9HYPH|nr:ABC transporter permease subunit [Martelella alba]TPW30476.1 ABC transporter permease subunit [Martelella alba]
MGDTFLSMTLKALSALAMSLASILVVLALWWGYLIIFDINNFVGKTPLDVWHYAFASPAAAANRASLAADMWISLGHAGLGFVAGMAIGTLLSASFIIWPVAERTMMPLALVLRSVPLVAMTPLITLIFGRGLGSVAVIGGLVVIFPVLINVVLGLRSGSPLWFDLVRSAGGGTFTYLHRIALPAALPSILTAARISVPGAFIGALLTEWLATGDGLGYRMQIDVTQFNADDLWTSVALVTGLSVAIYAVFGATEKLLLARMGLKR